MSKKDFIFWFDFVYFVAAVIGYFVIPSVGQALYIQLVATCIMPVLSLLNAGISASIYMDKKAANSGDNKNG